jgi:hypothetical protein
VRQPLNNSKRLLRQQKRSSMANITEESKGLAELLAEAENKDKTKPVIAPFNMSCDIDDEGCLTCGS